VRMNMQQRALLRRCLHRSTMCSPSVKGRSATDNHGAWSRYSPDADSPAPRRH
jgi:hypothetical protein